jgi:hypothetical protein
VPLSAVPLSDVTRAHVQSLVEDQVREARRVEFKASVGTNDAARREFLADVSSLANAAGGDLLIGIEETDGVASAVVGIAEEAVDGEILRLENLLRDGLDPRIPGVQTRPVPLGDGRSVLVMRVPRSWAAPHMVTFGGLSRFFSRNSAGKYPLDVHEIRAAFAGAEDASTRLASIRRERLARIVAGDVMPMYAEGGRIVLHLLPFSALDPGEQVDTIRLASDLDQLHHLFRPLYSVGWNTRITFDGAVVEVPPRPDDLGTPSYTLVFRSGVIESVDALLLQPPGRPLPSFTLEENLIEGLRRNLALGAALGVGLPVAVAVSLLGVRGRVLALPERYLDSPRPFDRDDLIFPETLLETFEIDAPTVLRPTFDGIWNAGGFPRSVYYDEDGAWGKR